MGFIYTVTEPAIEPVTVAEAKSALRVTSSDDDTRIGNLIESARKFAEEFCNMRIVEQTVDLIFDQFPAIHFSLGVYPIISVDSVKYDDTSSPKTEITLTEGDDYNVEIKSNMGRIRTLGGWPTVSTDFNSVRIRMTVGYQTSGSPLTVDVPEGIKEGIKLHVASNYLCSRGLLSAAKQQLMQYRNLWRDI